MSAHPIANVRRRDISLEEDRFDITHGLEKKVVWIATLDGDLSTGETVRLERRASTFPEALAALEAAIEENGWGIR